MKTNTTRIKEYVSNCFETINKAYREGYEDGIHSSISSTKETIDEAYQKGLSDAWECARKIGNNSQTGLEMIGFDFSEMKDGICLHHNPSWWVVDHYSASEAVQKIKEHKEKHKAEDEIKVRAEEEIEQKCHTCKHYTKGEYDGSCGSYICKEYSGWENKTE